MPRWVHGPVADVGAFVKGALYANPNLRKFRSMIALDTVKAEERVMLDLAAVWNSILRWQLGPPTIFKGPALRGRIGFCCLSRGILHSSSGLPP